MSGFTKGPWDVRPNHNGYRFVVVAGDKSVCNMRNDANGTGYLDAHLIAAAPELYEALSTAVAFIRDEGNETAHDMADKLEEVLSRAGGLNAE